MAGVSATAKDIGHATAAVASRLKGGLMAKWNGSDKDKEKKKGTMPLE
jgi:hypothetical protein